MSDWSLEYHDSIALLTFSRKPVNIYSANSVFELDEHLSTLARETDRVKAVVLTGGVEGFFINHGDLSDRPEFKTFGQDGQLHSPSFESWLDIFHRIDEIPQPTIAAIDGLASGGGNEIALACTMRVGSRRARLQQSEITSGFIPGGGSSVRLPRLVGPGIAAEAILTGRVFDVDEAFRAGWLNAILPVEGFVDHALEWTGRITQHSGLALFAAKMSVRDSLRLPFGEAIRREREIFRRYVADSGVFSGEKRA